MLQEGVGELKENVPVLLVLNKRDLIKPGEMAKKLEVRNVFLLFQIICFLILIIIIIFSVV